MKLDKFAHIKYCNNHALKPSMWTRTVSSRRWIASRRKLDKDALHAESDTGHLLERITQPVRFVRLVGLHRRSQTLKIVYLRVLHSWDQQKNSLIKRVLIDLQTQFPPRCIRWCISAIRCYRTRKFNCSLDELLLAADESNVSHNSFSGDVLRLTSLQQVLGINGCY